MEYAEAAQPETSPQQDGDQPWTDDTSDQSSESPAEARPMMQEAPMQGYQEISQCPMQQGYYPQMQDQGYGNGAMYQPQMQGYTGQMSQSQLQGQGCTGQMSQPQMQGQGYYYMGQMPMMGQAYPLQEQFMNASAQQPQTWGPRTGTLPTEPKVLDGTNGPPNPTGRRFSAVDIENFAKGEGGPQIDDN
jgi:hypothetical protein